MNLEGLDGILKVPFTYNCNFDTAIAAGASASVEVQIDNDGDFVFADGDFDVWLSAASGSAIIGTPATRESHQTIGSNTFMNLAHFRLAIEDTSNKWQNEPTRVSNLIRKGQANLQIAQRQIKSGSSIKVTLYNDSAESVKAQFSMQGWRLKKV